MMNSLDIDADINRQIDDFLSACKVQDEDSNFKLYQAMSLDRAKYMTIGHYPAFILNHEQVEFRTKEELKISLCRKLGL